MTTGRTRFRILIATIMAFFTLGALALASVSAQGESGTTLTASKTATAHYTKTFHWTISKSVTPDTLNMFKGDSGQVTYTISVTKDSGTEAAWIDGEITVTNGGAVATENLKIVDNVTNSNGSVLYATANVDLSAHPVLQPAETYVYAYRVDIPLANVVSGATYKDTADITITNHSGHLGTLFGPSPSATSVMPAMTLINDTINVDDSNGQSFAFSASGSQTYNKTFACDANKGKNDNTATIRETKQSASASVTVNCYALDVTKTANTSLTRTYNWTIAKSADQSALTLALNQSFPVNYTVTVNATGTDSNWAANGSITIHNPAPIAATLTGVSDTMSGGVTVTPNCGVSFPYTLAAGGDLTCTYSTSLSDASTRTNTATVTLQNTPSGTTDFSGTASVDFSKATITKVDDAVSVSDSLQGTLGTVTVGSGTLPKTFTYTRTVGPYTACGQNKIDNTATLTTNTNGKTGSASWTVTADVPCGGGCTLTLGYWKTHAGGVGNNADMVTKLLPIWLGTPNTGSSVQVTTASQAIQLLSFSGDASNGINKLYAQLLAAKLSIASGASSSAVSSTISAADAFLATHSSRDWNLLSKAEKNQVNSWASALDSYNNGLTGPGHCSVPPVASNSTGAIVPAGSSSAPVGTTSNTGSPAPAPTGRSTSTSPAPANVQGGSVTAPSVTAPTGPAPAPLPTSR